MFKKKDLRDRDVVTYKNGWKRTFIGGKLISEEGVVSKTIDEYNENLENLSFGGPSKENDLNIVKVERPEKYETVYENKEILDEVEKRYLRGVIRPFRDKVKTIEKYVYSGGNASIDICTESSNSNWVIELQPFPKYEMYNGMKDNKKYTLEELGL